jgi:hypothetical protein
MRVDGSGEAPPPLTPLAILRALTPDQMRDPYVSLSRAGARPPDHASGVLAAPPARLGTKRGPLTRRQAIELLCWRVSTASSIHQGQRLALWSRSMVSRRSDSPATGWAVSGTLHFGRWCHSRGWSVVALSTLSRGCNRGHLSHRPCCNAQVACWRCLMAVRSRCDDVSSAARPPDLLERGETRGGCRRGD